MDPSTPPPDAGERKYVYRLQETALQQALAARSAEKHAAFFLPYLHPGMQLLDCGSGPGSITRGLAGRPAPAKGATVTSRTRVRVLRVVVDTNGLVSALISPQGAAARLLGHPVPYTLVTSCRRQQASCWRLPLA